MNQLNPDCPESHPQYHADAYRRATGASSVTYREERREADGSLTVTAEATSEAPIQRKLRHKRPFRKMVDGRYRVTAMWDGTLRGTVTRTVFVRDGVAYDDLGDEYELILQSWLRDRHIPTTVVPDYTPGSGR